jgi:hypothetical protein
LDRAGVPVPQRPDYRMWARFYLDSCHKCGHPPRQAVLVFGTAPLGAPRL